MHDQRGLSLSKGHLPFAAKGQFTAFWLLYRNADTAFISIIKLSVIQVILFGTRHKSWMELMTQCTSRGGEHSPILSVAQQTRGIRPMLFQCWSSIEDAGLTLKQHWVNSPCLLGCCVAHNMTTSCPNTTGLTSIGSMPGQRRRQRTVVQRQTAVTAYFSCRQLLLFICVFVESTSGNNDSTRSFHSFDHAGTTFFSFAVCGCLF